VAVSGLTYTIYGYEGKQVRDNTYSHDAIMAFEAHRNNPRPGEVYNLGGGRGNRISVLEAISLVEEMPQRKMNWVYSDRNGIGDHICCISDLRKLRTHHPEWDITRSLRDIFREIIDARMTHEGLVNR